MMRLPGLHVVTGDEVLASPRFLERAFGLLRAHGPDLALHLRGPGTPAVRLHELAAALAPAAREHGALFLLNDRADIALAVDAAGVHLGGRSLPVATVRKLRQDWVVGASMHDPDEAAGAEGADYLIVGTIWATASHPGRSGAGTERIRQLRRQTSVPVLAIGGVTPGRAREAMRAGAVGVAVLSGVWDSGDPAAAASSYLQALGAEAEEAEGAA